MSTDHPAEAPPAAQSRLWLIFVGVIALQLAAWIAWLIVASKHPVEEIPTVSAPHH